MGNIKKILVVEDEVTLSRALTDKFSREGFAVMTASNGEDGLKIAFGAQPDLILLDIIMPKMDGLTMLRKLREDERGKSVPVIVLTNLSDAESMGKSVESGAFDFLVKSDWKIEDVAKKVKEKLNL